MKKNYLALLLAFIFSLSANAGNKTWLPLKSAEPKECKPVIHATSLQQTDIEITIPGYYQQELTTPRGQAYSITIPGAAKMLEEGMPDLPQVTFSLAIPDKADMKIEVVYSDYVDINPISIAPSKGNLTRDQDPSRVPFTYSQQYNANTYYPSDISVLRDPYVLRDYRGQAVVVRPFAYNPVTQTLRIFFDIKLRVYADNFNSVKNVLNRRSPVTAVDAAFAPIYRSHFGNSNVINYTPLNEHGNMLVISDNALMSTVQPFVNWKNRMGQHTELVDVATIGTTANDIKSYIENYYNTVGLTFVLLVGDGPQIPPFPSQYGDSDPYYGCIPATDYYPEVFVGRFSANNVAQLETQVQRSLDYEMYPDISGQWYHKAVCIGSDQGPGDDNEYDYEHERNMRTDMLGFLYTDADELYDGSQQLMDASGDPTAQDLINSLNDGRGLVTYTGHGSSNGLGTTGFSSNDVTSLTNYNQLPFFWSVACVNGNFSQSTCLAEALLRAKSSSGEAKGAIAAFMSTINQSWDPPMDAQDEMIDLLCELYPGNIKHTFGGLSANGCMHMNDQYGTQGDEMTATWTIFGDPSLMVRTTTPTPLAVSHALTVDVNATSLQVSCSTNNALICLSHNYQIISTAFSLAGGATLLPAGLTVGDTLDLVVTAYNKVPYFGRVIVTNTTLGINQVAATSLFLYPNPVNENFSLNLNEKSPVSIQVIDALGKTVLVETSFQNKFDVSALCPGVYSVIAFNKEKVFGVQQLVKK